MGKDIEPKRLLGPLLGGRLACQHGHSDTHQEYQREGGNCQHGRMSAEPGKEFVVAES